MAFSSLSSALINVGKPIIKSIFTTLKNNQDDLNTRLLTVEASTNKIVIFDGVITNATTYATATGLLFHRIQSAIDITDVKVGVFDFTGISSGTLSVDIQKASSLDFSASVSILTTQPSLNLATASNYDESTNAVLNVNKSCSEGDWLRIDISSLPTGLGKLALYIIGEPT